MSGSPSAAVRDARPAIEIDGQRDATLSSSLLDLQVLDSAEGLARCEATFGNWGGSDSGGFQHFGRDKLEFGKALKVTLGTGILFEGRISAITAIFPDGGTPQIAVCAEDRLQDLRMTRRTRAFENATLSSVLSSIANDHGLTPEASVSGETYKTLAQVNQSDLAFLRDLGRREDAQVWVDGTKLKAAQRAQRTGGTVEMSWAGQLREFTVSADLAHQRTKLIGSGWNVDDKASAKHEAVEAAISSELKGGTSGPSTLQRAFGDRPDILAHQVPASDAQARALAEATFRHLARRFVVGYGVAETNPDLRVGAKLKLKGLGPIFEGEYTVTDVAIRFDDKAGMRTEFVCDTPSIAQP